MLTLPNQLPPLGELHIDNLLRFLIEHGCSDLHIGGGKRPSVRRLGLLQQLDYPDLDDNIVKKMIYEGVFNDDQIKRYESAMQIDLSYEIKGLSRFRVNVFRAMGKVKAVFRAIPIKIPVLEEMELPFETLTKICHQPWGLVLVTGPTGSGKSTTLAALIDWLNKNHPGHHILTLEDPVEFVHQDIGCVINQRELNSDVLSFVDGGIASVREDPDIILVGEMRDLATTRQALLSAEMGHLVFATVHTNDAPSTVDRIIEQYPVNEQEQIRASLANSLKAVISQQLCLKGDGSGRIAALEIAIANDAIKNLIRTRNTSGIKSQIQTGRNCGMMTMEQHLARLCNEGKINVAEAEKHTSRHDELVRCLAAEPMR